MLRRDEQHRIDVRQWGRRDIPGLVALADRAGVKDSRRILLAQLDRQTLSPGPDRHFFSRLVAELDGSIVGTAVAHDHLFVPQDWLSARCHVDHRYRSLGVGSSLLSALDSALEECPPAGLVGRVARGDTVSRCWAERRGFTPDGSEVTCILDPRTVPATVAVDRWRWPDGLTLHSMAGKGGARSWTPVYELMSALLKEIPEINGAPGPSAASVEYCFSHWMSADPEATWVAARGDRSVGVTLAGRYGEGGLYTWFTGVDSAFRGKGIALALKLSSVEVAKSNGIRRMVSEVAETNIAMLNLNRTLGARFEEPVWVMRRPRPPHQRS